jgi:GTPase SAR1 family protein
MDKWRVAVLGDGGVGKTALAVQVRSQAFCNSPGLTLLLQFTLNCFVGV